MSKNYKKIYIDKVKQKFNDLQSGRENDRNIASKSQNDKRSEICKSVAMDKR